MTLLRRFALPLLLCASLASVAHAANVIIINNNAAGVGFNDPAPRAPVAGNPGLTLGDQRINVFNAAAAIWGGILQSTVTIEVRAQFANQTCTATSATLGSTGSNSIHRDFIGADYAGTWYVQSLGNKLFGADLNPGVPDMSTTFNMAIDAGCFGPGQVWYYGLDGLEGSNIEMLPVAIHEIGHGLNFATTTSGSTGALNSGFPSVYDRFLLDKVTGRQWSDPLETNAQRAASAISNDLVWTGASANAAAATYLSKRPALIVNSPGGIAGTYQVGTAGFGGAITMAGVTGNVVLMDDGTAPNPNDGCEALVNAGAIAGNIAIVDRGTCTFVSKALAAQNAGAIALIVANNVAGSAPGLGGNDPTITIPVISISQADGVTIKAQLGGGVNATIGLDPLHLAGADNNGRAKMYAPSPFTGGSSVSHWDVTMTPNALMEPAINNDLHNTVDLAYNLFVDIGWFPQPVATTLARFTAEGRGDGILVSWQFTDPADIGTVTLQRATAEVGPWGAIQAEFGHDGEAMTALDTDVEPAKTYFYRLALTDKMGRPVSQGLVSASRSGSLVGRTFLAAPMPNPAPHGSAIAFKLGRPEFVRLAITDASGRNIRTLQNGMLPAGDHIRVWDGRDGSGDVANGVYFVTLHTSAGKQSQRLAVIH